MVDVSILERLKTIFELIKSQSFFITLFIILILTVIVLLINIRVKSQAPKYAVAIVYTGLAVLMLARYGQYMLSLNDSIVDKFFRAMYFPNIVVYLSMLIITILLLIIIIINKKTILFTKITSFLCFFVIWFLFVLTVDTIKKEGLSFYEVTEIYSNGTIMILMQASMCIFGLWCGIMICDLIIRSLSNKMDKKEKQIKENDEIEDYTNEDFNNNNLNDNNNTYNEFEEPFNKL